MAVVEKRKNAWLALFLNHLMFMVIAAFMIPFTGGTVGKILCGAVCLLYYHGVHEYCRKSASEHSKPYIVTEPSWKFPLYYGAVGSVYFWLPVILELTVGAVFQQGSMGKIIVNIIYVITHSPFIFANVFSSNEYNSLNIIPTLVFFLLFFASSFSGYYLGLHGNSIAKFIGRFKKKKKKKKKQNKI